MGIISGAVDIIILVFSAAMILIVPLFDAQICIPARFFPSPLTGLMTWYIEKYEDYTAIEKPFFLIGYVWIVIVLVWPLSIANVYGILARRPWIATTSLMTGSCLLSAMAPVLAELIGSGRAPDKLLQIYFPFLGFAILAILRGLFSGGPRQKVIKAAASIGPSARKKRA